MVLILLMYYRHYVTQRFIGALFGIDVASVCRIIKNLVMKLPKRTGLQPEELECLIIDATQKQYYSGKKKRHTIKTEIRVTRGVRVSI
jgi:hypothetical protein